MSRSANLWSKVRKFRRHAGFLNILRILLGILALMNKPRALSRVYQLRTQSAAKSHEQLKQDHKQSIPKACHSVPPQTLSCCMSAGCFSFHLVLFSKSNFLKSGHKVQVRHFNIISNMVEVKRSPERLPLFHHEWFNPSHSEADRRFITLYRKLLLLVVVLFSQSTQLRETHGKNKTLNWLTKPFCCIWLIYNPHCHRHQVTQAGE